MAITYSSATNTITVTAYTSGTPCNFTDLYNADKAGTLSLHARTGITSTDASAVAVDRAERPIDYIVLGGSSNDLYISVANWNGITATIRITGTDRDGTAQTEDILVTANGTYYTTKWFKTITYTQVTAANVTTFDYDLTQGQWGVVSGLCTNQFCFDCKIQIGDGTTTTWFADDQKEIIFSSLGHWVFVTKNAGHTRLGVLTSESNKATTKGCSVFSAEPSAAYIFDTESGGVFFFYSSTFFGNQSSYLVMRGATKIYNSTFNRTYLYGATNVTMYNVTFSSPPTYAMFANAGTWDTINIKYAQYGLGLGGSWIPLPAQNAKNVVIKGCTNSVRCYDMDMDCSIINGDLDNWTINWYGSTGKLYRKYEFDLKLVDSAGTGIDTTKIKIWDKGNSLVTNTSTNASGVLATQTLNYGYYNTAGGNTPVMETPHEMRIYKYGKEMLSSKSSIEAKTDWAFTMYTDDHITQTTEATVAAYTGITINHTAETITISSNHTLDEIYDYCQYDIIAATKQLDQTMHTADGVNFVSEYSFVVNTGIAVTATDQKLSMVSGETYTLTGTAQFTGIIATTTTTRIPIKLTNIIDGSRYWVGKESDGSTIFESTQSGSGDVVGYYEHTTNINIDIRVRKSSASTKYKPWVGEGTLAAEAFSLRIRQIQDSIVT